MTDCPEPVLLIAFNRPDLLAGVIDQVRQVRPPRVYLAVDGPRPDRPDEAERVQACRDLVQSLDWGCHVQTLFRDVNVGCGRGVSGAITWFFSHEERGIILEDDIHADVSFFGFAAELLERYQDDDRVFAITGTNFVPPDHVSGPGGYRFSRVPVVWGWATWRHSWERYSFDIAGWQGRLPFRKAWHAMGAMAGSYVLWSANFHMMARHVVDTWDLQLVYASMADGAFTATPNVNLVENAGFRHDATHTLRMPAYLRTVESMPLPTEPPAVELDHRADRWLMKNVYEATAWGMTRQVARYARRSVQSRTRR
jgi:hypothetical protein